MPTFEDFDAYAGDDEHLDLPIHGHIYRIHPMGIRDGALIARYRAGDTAALDKMTEEDVLRMTLGPAYDEMLERNISKGALGRAHMTAMAFHEGGVEMARRVWDRSIDPELGAALGAAMKAQTPNRATRRTSTRSSNTAAAAKTRTRASSSGTSSPKATRPAAGGKRNTAT